MMMQSVTQASANLRFLRYPGVAIALAVAWLGSSFSTTAQQYEYEPDEGLHQEEWYDPSDWFDNEPGVDYETDWWDTWDYPGTGYDYDYGYGYGGLDDYRTDYDYGWHYDSDYGWHYDWDADRTYDSDRQFSETDRNGRQSQAANRTTSGTSERNNRQYGLHYDWDPVNGNWRSDYGFYTQQYAGDAPGDYGWHYDWDPNQRQWVEDYGFHTSNYDFDYSKYDYSNENIEQSRANQQTKTRQEMQRASNMAREHQRGQHVVVGQIDRIRDTDRENLIKLRLENGETVTVDFGSQKALAQLELEAGSRVVIEGRQGQVDGEDVLFARQVTVDGEPHAIEENQQWSESRNQQQRDQQARSN
jgi:hypothetical protein